MAKPQSAGIFSVLRSGKQGGPPKIDRRSAARSPANEARFVLPAKVMSGKLAATMFAERVAAVRVVTDLAEPTRTDQTSETPNRRVGERGPLACSFRRPAENTSRDAPGQGLLCCRAIGTVGETPIGATETVALPCREATERR